MAFAKRLQEILASFKRHGLGHTFEALTVRLLNRVTFFTILRCLTIDTVDPQYLECDECYEGQFLMDPELRHFASSPEYQLPAKFLDDAGRKDDACYGFLCGDVLASYGWYSRSPTDTSWPGLSVEFSRDFVYMYNGFTHPGHRGKRLHAVGMMRALAAYRAQGFKGIVSYVEATNFSSLKSCYRMGYSEFGRIYAARLFNRYFLYANSGSRRFGFRLVERDCREKLSRAAKA